MLCTHTYSRELISTHLVYFSMAKLAGQSGQECHWTWPCFHDNGFIWGWLHYTEWHSVSRGCRHWFLYLVQITPVCLMWKGYSTVLFNELLTDIATVGGLWLGHHLVIDPEKKAGAKVELKHMPLKSLSSWSRGIPNYVLQHKQRSHTWGFVIIHALWKTTTTPVPTKSSPCWSTGADHDATRATAAECRG